MKLAEQVFVEQPLEIHTLVLATHPFENITGQVTTLLLMMTLSIAIISYKQLHSLQLLLSDCIFFGC